MPFPRTLARINRYVTNPIARTFAERLGPFAVLINRGRTSGDEYRTPVFAFPTGDGFVVALFYGRNTDWGRNVLARGSCTIVYRNEHHVLTDPRFVKTPEAAEYVPAPVRLFLRVLRVDDFLRLNRSS